MNTMAIVWFVMACVFAALFVRQNLRCIKAADRIRCLRDDLEAAERAGRFWQDYAKHVTRDTSKEEAEIQRLKNLLCEFRKTLNRMKGRNQTTMTFTRSWLP